MKEEFEQLFNKKGFHIGILTLIIFLVIIFAGFISLKYQVEGEKNTPFIISKVLVISSAEGKDREQKNEEMKWNFDINQNNDIYVYIDKNGKNGKSDSISEVNIKNLEIKKENNKGKVKFYKPDITNNEVIFSNKNEFETNDFIYLAEEKTDMKNMKISNQGGIVVFRCANNSISEYMGNEEEINHDLLLKKSNVNKEEIRFNIKFNLIIKLDSGKNYETTISLDLPTDNIIEEGTTSKEYSESEGFVLKRIKE